jgi:DNA-binding CsgD family transcriptional regulator
MRSVFADYLAENWPNRTDRVPRGIRMNRPRFLTDTDFYTEAEFEAQPVYRKFLAPRRLDATAGTHIGGAADGELILSVWGFRSHDAMRAGITWLDDLRPHLARSCLVSAETGLAGARSAVEALGAINVPAVLLGRSRHVLASNARFRLRLSEFGRIGPLGLRLADRAVDDLLGTLLEDVERQGGAVPLRLSGGGRAVLHVLPTPWAPRDLMTGARALLVLTTPRQRRSPTSLLIAALYDLTPTEGRVAQALAETLSLEIAAKRLGMSITTARSHLKSIFRETGVRRQSELIALLSQLNLPP